MTIRSYHRLLLTGAAGGLGRVLRQQLKDNCHVLRLSDRAELGPAGAQEEIALADLADASAVNAAVAGVDAIVHLGGMSVEGPFEPILQANIVGVYNLYEAARKHGVKRIVFASSNHVTGYYSQGETITADDAPRPDGLYGVSKAFGENLARMYFDRYRIETACIRIGSVLAQPIDRRTLASWLSPADLHRLISACLETPILGHSIVFGMSNNAVVWWDNAKAKHVGFQPQDSADLFREAIFSSTAAPDPSDPVAQYQGGSFLRIGPFE